MKKLILALVVLAFASNAFGAAAAIPALEGFKHSKGVSGLYESADSASTGIVDVYSVGTKHASGNKNYHTGSTTTYMYQASVNQTDTVTCATVPGSVTDLTIFSGYTQM